ncbi:hypothetical protein H6G97_45675 [Nostoc flagelliforme FACHB-838]|uniref:N-acetyltransferase domain-containing protein n=2 Tax=Nostoc flagelliforme TaxID=1306274 RepID=A0ABR8E3J3_9NOSO|nr:hypothetical protein [Nostoc flagelliforme]MBD2536206.1 hypothetical protein [Nostoc flagelliforme FACHB-838]
MYIADVLNYARSKFNPTLFRITVAAFNERALKAWKKAGFQQIQSFQALGDKELFIILARHI